ncbi:type II secretion system protein [Vibrio sp. HN007]|uniref:type II secretion system protein n=1 Tax=Vibrio iocasae TaxID=3098914 RepID=UPI0035D43B37
MKGNVRSKCVAGFTLIELVIVTILLGIISVYAASRYIGKSSFSTYAAQEQAISIVRQIQLGRMYSNVTTPDDNYQLEISGNCLGSVQSCDLSDDDAETISNRLLIDDSLTLSSTHSLINFDLLGNPDVGAVTITISNASGTESNRVCINAQGYVNGC